MGYQAVIVREVVTAHIRLGAAILPVTPQTCTHVTIHSTCKGVASRA